MAQQRESASTGRLTAKDSKTLYRSVFVFFQTGLIIQRRPPPLKNRSHDTVAATAQQVFNLASRVSVGL